MSNDPKPVQRRACPLCGKPTDLTFRPFCSKGCRDRDLIEWLDGGYKVPGPAVDPDKGDDDKA